MNVSLGPDLESENQQRNSSSSQNSSSAFKKALVKFTNRFNLLNPNLSALVIKFVAQEAPSCIRFEPGIIEFDIGSLYKNSPNTYHLVHGMLTPEYFENEAKKAINKQHSFFGKFLSLFNQPDYQSAGDFYTKAANIHKANGDWSQAIEKFKEAKECYVKADSPTEAAQALASAASCAKSFDFDEASALTDEAAEFYVHSNRFNAAGRLYKALAQSVEESDHSDKHGRFLMELYEKAAKFFELDGNSSVSRNQCLQTFADYNALHGNDCMRSINIYKEAMNLSLKSDIVSKLNSRKHWVKLILVILANQSIDKARKEIEFYADADIYFKNCKECTELIKMVEAAKDSDTSAFHTAVDTLITQYHSSQWHNHFYTQIHNKYLKSIDITLAVDKETGEIDLT